MKYNIKKLINKDILDKQIEINSDDYGGAAVQVAVNVMEFLDNFEGEFNIGYSPDMTTPHGIICECDDQGGITGFMAGAARNIVAHCHEFGWKFYLADVISQYDIDDEGHIDKCVNNVMNLENIEVSEKDVIEYVQGLKSRFLQKNNFR
jgi:flavodoxin